MCKEKSNTKKATAGNKLCLEEILKKAYRESKESGYKKITYPSEVEKEKIK